MKKLYGFTLLEVIVVIIIVGLLAAMSGAALKAGLNNYFASQDLNNANWQGRLVLEQIARKLHSISSPANINTATATSLVFTDMNAVVNTYTFNSGASTLTYNIPTTGTQNLATNITAPGSVFFTYFDGTGAAISSPVSAANLLLIRFITINFTITINNIPYTFRTTINPNNLNPAL